MIGHGSLASVAVLELAVRTFLSNQFKPEVTQDSYDLVRLENGDAAAHACGSNGNSLGPDKLRFQPWLPILKQHGYHLPEIVLQFIERLALRVGAWKTGHEANEQPGFRALFHDGGERMHR
jgi:hypothetical protein